MAQYKQEWWLTLAGLVAHFIQEYSNKIFNFDRVEINFTFSAGVSTSSEVFSNHQMASREKVGVLINMADQRMYHAKGMGKNRVVFEI